MMSFAGAVVDNSTERANDIARAVRLLRQHGLNVGFPEGDIIFAVGKDTLTAGQILGLLERRELHVEGVRK